VTVDAVSSNSAVVARASAPHPKARGGRPRLSRRTRQRLLGLAYAAPALALFTAIVLVPLVQSMVYSGYQWDGVSEPTFVGFDNYVNFFADPDLRDSLVHVLVLVVFFALLPSALGLVTAGLLGRERVAGDGAFRVILFLPQVLTSIVVAIVWGRVLGPDGPLNTVLRAVGLDVLAINWLGDFTWALPALGLIGSWTNFGLCLVLFLSGMGTIPKERYEAARLDGAGPLGEFRAVTLPGLRTHLTVALTLTITGALRTFDLVWNTTRGGPGSATTTPALMLYRFAFKDPQIGQASAIGIVTAVFCLLVALFLSRMAEQR
jgi:raffinose/stachyose/melibiose transport system permease protein